MKIRIEEEGGCELYTIYVDGLCQGHVYEGLEIDTEKDYSKCTCSEGCVELECDCKCHKQ